MTARVDAGAFSIHDWSVHSASERSSTKVPSSIHSKVARPLPIERPSTTGSNSHVPMRRLSGDSAIVSAGPRRGDGILGEDGVDLTDRLGDALLHAHGEDLLHRLAAWEGVVDRHARAPLADLLDRHPELVARQLVVRCPVAVGEAVVHVEPVWWIGLQDVPVATELVAFGPGHVVLD